MSTPSFHLTPLFAAGIMVLAGFFLGEAARRIKLPALIGYMTGGLLLGPSVTGVLDHQAMASLSFLTQLGLGLVAFTIGSELDLQALKKLGRAIVVIIFAESFLAALVVVAAIFLLTGDLAMALLFGAMAPASAPAGTVAVIQEYRARGELTKALYAVVGFDDGLAVILYGVLFALVKVTLAAGPDPGTGILPALVRPLGEITASIGVGCVVGWCFRQLARPIRKPQESLILLAGVVLTTTGLSELANLSVILSNMTVGLVVANLDPDTTLERLRTPLMTVMPLVYILFFSLAGAHLELASLTSLGLIGAVYIAGRSGGLMGGAWLGAVAGGAGEKIRKYLGFGILSQAGVAIGLSLLASQELSRLVATHHLPHAKEIGAAVLATITASSVVFEIIGPLATRYALAKAGEIPGLPAAVGSRPPAPKEETG